MATSEHGGRKSGKYNGWFAVINLFVAWFLWSGTIKGLGVMLPTLMEQFSSQTWLIGWMIAFVQGMAFLSGPLAAPLESIFGTRAVVIASGLIIGVSFIIASFTTSVLQLTFLTALGFGPGMSLINILTRAMIGWCFTTNYATANGIGHTGSPLGIIAMAPLVQLLLDTYGWRGTMMLLGGLLLHLVVGGALLNHPPTKVSYNVVPTSENGESSRRLVDSLKTIKKRFGISICFRAPFWVTSLIYICNNLVGGFWFIYFVDHVQAKGFSAQDAVVFTSAAGLSSLLCKAASGPVVDKEILKIRPAMLILILLSSLSLLIEPWINSYWLMMSSSVIFLGGSGALNSLNDILTKELVGQEDLVAALSWMELALGIVTMASGFLPGWIYDLTGSYDIAFVIMGLLIALSLVALFLEWLFLSK